MVVLAERIVSPESCTTMFSTPCVLGCCGPMLTVITSCRSSGIGDFAERRKREEGRREVRIRRRKWSVLAVFLLPSSVLHLLLLHQLTHDVEQGPMHFLHAR